MDLKNLLYDKSEGIGTITINRPKAMNGINTELLLEFIAILNEIKVDDEVLAVIITGGDKVFAAGADIPSLAKFDAATAEEFIELCHLSQTTMASLPKPIIAAVAGMALGGGCETVLACDIRIAAEGSSFGLPEINLGLFPGGGGTQRIARSVGLCWAKYLVLTGQSIDAEKALQIGLINEVVPLAELMPRARKLARILASKSPIAMRTAKQCVDYSLDVDLVSGRMYERKAWAFLYSTGDPAEGLNAFLEKRKPVFTGK